jgi:hypothetical protein
LPAPDVLLPTAGAVLAAATSSILSIQIGYNGLDRQSNTSETDTAETTKETETKS